MTDNILALIVLYLMVATVCAAFNSGNYDGGTKLVLAVIWPALAVVWLIDKLSAWRGKTL